MATLALQVNGASRSVEIDDPATPLLYVLRNDLALTGTRFGCGLAQCGACTVLLAGRAIRSCVTPVSAVAGQPVTTIEGLAKDGTLPQISPPPDELKQFVAGEITRWGKLISEAGEVAK